MDDDDEKDDTKRKSRNLSEKKRRDQFNLLVNELSSMVSNNSRKMDKSTVLKSTIAFLKNHNEIADRSKVHEIQENWKPAFLPNEEFTHLILEALDGFIIVFSTSGKIHYASESITSLLGHLPNDLLQMTIYEMVYEEEQQDIYNILLNPPKAVVEPQQGGINAENQVSFLCHVKRGSMETPPKVSYEYVQFTGYFRNNIDVENMMPSSRYSGYSDNDSRSLFVGTGRLMIPQLIREISIVDTKSEFTSRYSLEWKFLFLDHRAAPIIGYLPFEVLGTSGYDYYHFDDLQRVSSCHEALMQKGEGTSCFYRFLTKGQQWIWLQTRFYITYHQWNSKPEFVVCTHRVVSYADVMKHMRKSNASMLQENEDNDMIMEDRKASASTSNFNANSPWSSKNSRTLKSFTQTQASPNVKMRRYQSYRPDSDSTSISADSQLSHHSLLTQHSSASKVSKRSRSQQSIHSVKTPQQSHFSQFNIPQSQAAPSSSQYIPTITFSQPQSIVIHPPAVPTQITHNQRPLGQSPLIGTPFIDQSQYLTAIPVQPVYPATATVISSPTAMQSTTEYAHSNMVLTPAQNQIQDHLQRKHEELQKIIIQQQDELRRVSEQLFMARYGIIPSIVNVSVPFVAPMDQQGDVGGENNRNFQSTSTHMTHTQYHHQQHQPHMIHHTQMSSQSQINPQMHLYQGQSIQQQHPPHVPALQYEVKPNILEPQQSIDSTDQQNDDIMQFMQHHSNQPSNSNSNQTMPQQQHDEYELMPFQMMNQQAQILFSSGNNNESAKENSSNK